MERGLRYLVAAFLILGGIGYAREATGNTQHAFWLEEHSPNLRWEPRVISEPTEIARRKQSRRAWGERAQKRLSESCKPLSNAENFQLELQSMFYRNGQPVWVLRDTNSDKKYRMRFGAEIYPSAAVNCLHAKLGLPSVKQEIFPRLTVRSGRISLKRMAKFWVQAANMVPWNWHFDPEIRREGYPPPETYELRNVLLEEIQSTTEQDSKGGNERFANIGWEEMSSADWQRLTGKAEWRALWLLGVLFENYSLSAKASFVRDRGDFAIRDFDYSLGSRDYFSSPNLFADDPFIDYGAAKVASANAEPIEFNYKLAGPARALAENADANDILLLLTLLEKITIEDYRSIFLESGYPEALAELYARKINGRYLRLRDVFLRSPSVPNLALKSFGARNHRDFQELDVESLIEKGIVRANIPGFPMLLLDSSGSRSIRNNSRWLFGKATALAEEMIAHAPFLGVEKSIGKHWHIGPGWIIRVERKVSSNPDATGAHDLFLVKDKFKVNLMLGVGLGGSFLGQTVWASGAPGFSRMYVYTHTAATYEEGKAAQWRIAPDIYEKSDFNLLERGSTMAIRSGFSLNLIAGGNLKFGTKKLRGSTYFMRSSEWLGGVQARRRNDDSWQIITETGDRGLFGSKLYLRFLHRSLRVPIAHYRNSHGISDYEIYELKSEEIIGMSAAQKNRWQIALEERDFSGVFEGRHTPFQQRSDYKATDSEINIDLFRKKYSAGTSRVRWQRIDGSVQEFFVTKSANSLVFKGDGHYEQEACSAVALVLTDGKETTASEIQDRVALHTRCELKDDKVRFFEWQHNMERNAIASGLHLPEADIKAWLDEYPEARADESKVDWQTDLWFGSDALAQVMSMSKGEFEAILELSEDKHTVWDSLNKGIVVIARSIRHEVREISVRKFWDTFFAETSPLVRMELLVGQLGGERSSSLMRFLTLQLMEPSFGMRSVRVHSQNEIGTTETPPATEPLATQIGEMPKMEAVQLLREWEELNSLNYLRSI